MASLHRVRNVTRLIIALVAFDREATSSDRRLACNCPKGKMSVTVVVARGKSKEDRGSRMFYSFMSLFSQLHKLNFCTNLGILLWHVNDKTRNWLIVLLTPGECFQNMFASVQIWGVGWKTIPWMMDRNTISIRKYVAWSSIHVVIHRIANLLDHLTPSVFFVGEIQARKCVLLEVQLKTYSRRVGRIEPQRNVFLR